VPKVATHQKEFLMTDSLRLEAPGLYQRFKHVADEAASFATAEARASNLPGRFGGPADSYRHIVWVGEMTRRVGFVPARSMAEKK